GARVWVRLGASGRGGTRDRRCGDRVLFGRLPDTSGCRSMIPAMWRSPPAIAGMPPSARLAALPLSGGCSVAPGSPCYWSRTRWPAHAAQDSLSTDTMNLAAPFSRTTVVSDTRPRDDELDLFGLTHPGRVRK